MQSSIPETKGDFDLNFKFEMSYFNMIGTTNDCFMIVESNDSIMTRLNLPTSQVPTEPTKKHQVRLIQMVRLSQKWDLPSIHQLYMRD